ncbi:fimbria/pilus periplasmic chaperone [Providencia sp. wls1943]|uniref:fimbria/pilus periplasmic chaperone n=1 Tax=Providencia sp. wls1943 TaxID=2675150 RepID=UPI0012B53908|nr:fimbria/pilus periplasmic chaperone [Providencia sp. wls1943]MTB66952.1 fimbria/pilus periplasmic chaperone [Providencia sp. wls1943]
MRHNRFMQGICSGLLLLSASSLAGVAIDTTRIIFSASDNSTGKSVGVTSSSQSATPYLIKAQILQTPYGDNGETPFVVTPSLFRLEPSSTNQDEMRVTADEFDAQRCQQYSYSLVRSPMTEPVQSESRVDTLELAAKGNHALLEASQNHKPHRIYTSIRALQNALTTIWQPIAQHRERLMLASAHNAHLQQQTAPAGNEAVSDEPTEVIITLVLPPSEQRSETEQIESIPIDMPSKPIEVTIPTTKKTSVSTNLGGDIRSASSRHYTLQLGSAASAEGLYEQARRHKLSNYLVYETVRNNRQWYVLVYGEYPSIRSAKHAIQNLPSAFQRDKPWVCSIQHVQSELN